MVAVNQFRLPDVGEGLTEAEIVTWHVAVGDEVAINDTLVEVETAKSIVELPSPFAGVVHELHAPEGELVPVGTTIISITEPTEIATAIPPASAATTPIASAEKPLVLVGTGPSAAAVRRKRLTPRTDLPVEPPVSGTSGRARANPPVRALARQLNVDLDALAARTGGFVTRQDVETAAAAPLPAMSAASPHAPRETRTPIRGVRKAMASAMVSSAFTAPHVTEWLSVDVTATLELITQLRATREWADVRITPLVFVAKALLLAARRYPEINATWDEAAQEVVVKHYVNLGIAAATPRGLLVPNIKDADAMDMRELANALDGLIGAARSNSSQPLDMADGTITITNIGALGVDAGTPILNPGEAAILAFGTVREMPWVVDGAIVPRKITQLALSFDHRLVDGELGSQVLVAVARLLTNPAIAILER